MIKTCLIVGSSSSLGKKIKEHFSSNNYHVFETNRKEKYLNQETNFYLDYNDKESLDLISQKVPKLDCLIFCSGILLGKDLHNYEDWEIDQVFNINILGPIKLLRRFSDKFKLKSKVLFIGSIAGSNGSFDEVYGSSKSAIYALVKSIAKKSKNGLRCNCISPGLIEDSTMYRQFSSTEISSHKNQTPTGELIAIDDLAKVCFDICQDEWNQLNGQIININGGRHV